MKTEKISVQKICMIAFAICINFVGGQIALFLKLPIFLDSIGTVFVAAVLGPFYGMLPNLLSGLLIDFHNLINAEINLAVGVVFGVLHDTPCVQTEQSCFICDFEHIVVGGGNSSAVKSFGTLGKNLHIRCLHLVWLCHNGLRLATLHFGNWEVEHILRPYVRKLLVHLHKLGNIVEFGKSLFGAVAVACGLQLCL